MNSFGDLLDNDFAKDFTGIFIIRPLVQSDGISSCSQIFVNKGLVAASSESALTVQQLSYHGQELFHSSINLWLG